VDLVWIAFQIYTAVSEGRDLCEDGWAEYSHGIAGVWNVIDWVQIFVTVTVAAIWFTMVGYLVDMLIDGDNGADGTDFVDTIDLIVGYSTWYKGLSVINLFILLLRFFKGFSAQPRLRVLVDAISGAAVDLAHWFIIFVSLLLAFVMNAMFLFGHQVEIFSDASKALFYSTRGWIVANAIPYNAFFETDPTLAISWFILYTLIMMFVVQKMVLAIILGSFARARGANRDARTLWAQTSDFCVDMQASMQKLMKLSDVIRLLEEPEFKLNTEERINLNMLLESYHKYHKLSPKQEEYSQKFSLSLMQEFFANYDKIRKTDMYVRRTNAYARTTQFDDDFIDLHERLDQLEEHADEVLRVLRAEFALPQKKVEV